MQNSSKGLPTPRALYLELCAAGVNMATGELDSATAERLIRHAGAVHGERLLERVRESRDGLRGIVTSPAPNLRAIREEGRSSNAG